MLTNIAVAVIITASTAVVVPTDVHHPKFSERHPKIYRVYKGIRRICLAIKPIVEVTAAAAQITTPFLLH